MSSSSSVSGVSVISQHSIEAKAEDIKFDDNAKKFEFAEKHGLDLEKEFDQYEQMYQDSLANQTAWDKMISCGFNVNFTNKKYMVWMLAIFSSFAGLLSGVDQSLISGAYLKLPEALGLSAREQSLVSSLMPLGAVGGAILLSPLSELFGRRMTVIIACVFYTVGAILEAAAHEVGEMYAGRFLLGVGVGLESIVTVLCSESCPMEMRGNLVSLYQFFLAFGELVGYAIGAMFINVEGSWRYILGSSLVFSTILMFGMFCLPESPRYLMHKGKIGAAYGVWKRLRDVDLVENKLEFIDMRQSLIQEQEAQKEAKHRFKWMDFITVGRCRRSLIYANMMVFLGQFTGVNGVMYYMSSLMSRIGFNETNSVFMSTVGGAALFLGTIPAIRYMDTCGRRFWANSMLPCFLIGLILVGVGYLMPLGSTAGLGLYLTGLILYMGFFGSYACLTWVIPSEVYPTYLRSYGMTTSASILYLSSFAVTYNFESMAAKMTNTGLMMGFYGGIAVLGWFYQLFFMPETKGKTLEEIDDLFSKPTRYLVKENLKATKRDFYNLFHGNFKQLVKGEETGVVN